jgi:hypothetical protein
MDRPLFVLTDPGTAMLVTGAYAIVIDKKTGKIVKVVPEEPGPDPWKPELTGAGSGAVRLAPEKPDPEPWKPDPTPWRQVEVIAAGLEALRTTEGVKAAEEVRVQTVQTAEYLASVVQTVTTEITGRTMIR